MKILNFYEITRRKMLNRARRHLRDVQLRLNGDSSSKDRLEVNKTLLLIEMLQNDPELSWLLQTCRNIPWLSGDYLPRSAP